MFTFTGKDAKRSSPYFLIPELSAGTAAIVFSLYHTWSVVAILENEEDVSQHLG